jgi:hypothetical protein
VENAYGATATRCRGPVPAFAHPGEPGSVTYPVSRCEVCEAHRPFAQVDGVSYEGVSL